MMTLDKSQWCIRPSFMVGLLVAFLTFMLAGFILPLFRDSIWEKTVTVLETFRGKTVWDGDVEVFSVKQPKAETCYAWSTAEGKFTAVLGIPPATDHLNTVKVSSVAETKKGTRQ